MVKMISDRTGRFLERPHYRPEELDRECEEVITRFLHDTHGEVRFPVATDDLTKLIERDAADLDLYADLSHLGPDVEGVTEFHPSRKPTVRISAELSGNSLRENRLRTTLSHEYGHVHFHAYLWATRRSRPDLLVPDTPPEPTHCKRESMLDAPMTDWMEWQAGYVCGSLLMPRSNLIRIIAEYQESHGIFGPVSAGSKHGRTLAAKVVDAFQVSEDAARVRLEKLNLLGAERGRSLFD